MNLHNSLLQYQPNIFKPINDAVLAQAKEIEKAQIKGLDALHLACAEELKVDYFLTCDDKILKRYKGSIKLQNPADFVINILKGGNK
ncbi:MAG: PIN domain-containing protein [Candidatus Anstonellales archaeon]